MVEIILGNKFDPLFIIIITNEEIIDLFIHFSNHFTIQTLSPMLIFSDKTSKILSYQTYQVHIYYQFYTTDLRRGLHRFLPSSSPQEVLLMHGIFFLSLSPMIGARHRTLSPVPSPVMGRGPTLSETLGARDLSGRGGFGLRRTRCAGHTTTAILMTQTIATPYTCNTK